MSKHHFERGFNAVLSAGSHIVVPLSSITGDEHDCDKNTKVTIIKDSCVYFHDDIDVLVENVDSSPGP